MVSCKFDRLSQFVSSAVYAVVSTLVVSECCPWLFYIGCIPACLENRNRYYFINVFCQLRMIACEHICYVCFSLGTQPISRANNFVDTLRTWFLVKCPITPIVVVVLRFKRVYLFGWVKRRHTQKWSIALHCARVSLFVSSGCWCVLQMAFRSIPSTKCFPIFLHNQRNILHFTHSCCKRRVVSPLLHGLSVRAVELWPPWLDFWQIIDFATLNTFRCVNRKLFYSRLL